MSYSRFLLPVLVCVLFLTSCSKKDDGQPIPKLDFREEMRDFVQSISAYAKNQNSNFIIVPQNGQEILTITSKSDGAVATDYVNAIDAVGREDLFYGYTGDDVLTPTADNEYLVSICNVAK
ncbi:MAG TPA: hypothetical protein VL443_00420, partial [Cyclobacteriaceae bacterium]|nr:hypothetical protein [Cyclobacteriaceae bacterium]